MYPVRNRSFPTRILLLRQKLQFGKLFGKSKRDCTLQVANQFRTILCFAMKKLICHQIRQLVKVAMSMQMCPDS